MKAKSRDQFSDTQTIKVKEDAYQDMLKNGLVFILNVPTRKPGPMQLRVAVRDSASESIGSASEFVQVPDLSTNRLALSGIYLSGSRQVPANSSSAGSDEKKSYEAESDGRPGYASFAARHAAKLFLSLFITHN